MDKQLLIDEMHAAVQRLNAAADAYYNGREELMTDFEWDALFDRVKVLEAETGVVLPDSPTNRVSADSTEGEKEAHEFPALSLAKTKKVTELAKWADGRSIWLSWKLDGLTLVVTYDDGKLVKVVTRGDGHIGTNITRLAPAIAGIPEKISARGHLVIRGEAVISYADFEAFLASSEEEYANPRNLASGSLTLKDVDELRPRHLQWIPFTLVHADTEFASWGAGMDYLQSLGFSPVARERVDAPTVEKLQQVIERWTKLVTDRVNPFPVDGLVITYDDVAYARTGSVTGHHATRAGYAFKWQDETATTELDHIEWNSAVAWIAPVAVFKSVQLEGTTVQRASLFNISECERLGIGGKGSRLEVIKANKIIPKIVRVTERVGRFEIPSVCPVCAAPTELRESVTGTKTLHCTNAACPSRTLHLFMRFVSKAGLDIEGLAGETLAKFVNRGWIRNFADILRLDEHADEITKMEGFGAKSAANIRESLRAARRRDAVHFLVALSIPMCGPDVAKRLLARYSLAELIARAEDAAQKRGVSDAEAAFASVEGIGPAKSAAFVAWFANGTNRMVVADLLRQLEIEEAPKADAAGLCAGLTFVITGDVHHYANRAELKAYIESAGGKVAGSVTSKTNFLINNDVTSTSSKNQKAQSLGIPIISEEEFRTRFTK